MAKQGLLDLLKEKEVFGIAESWVGLIWNEIKDWTAKDIKIYAGFMFLLW
jgi:hypothetical protein